MSSARNLLLITISFVKYRRSHLYSMHLQIWKRYFIVYALGTPIGMLFHVRFSLYPKNASFGLYFTSTINFHRCCSCPQICQRWSSRGLLWHLQTDGKGNQNFIWYDCISGTKNTFSIYTSAVGYFPVLTFGICMWSPHRGICHPISSHFAHVL